MFVAGERAKMRECCCPRRRFFSEVCDDPAVHVMHARSWVARKLVKYWRSHLRPAGSGMFRWGAADAQHCCGGGRRGVRGSLSVSTVTDQPASISLTAMVRSRQRR